MWGFHVAKYCYVFVCIITPKTSTEKWTENSTPRWFYTGTRGPRTCAVFNQTSNILISKTLDGTVATDGTAASGSRSDLRRAIALARHRAPKRCTRRVIFSAPWSTHKQTPESGCKDTYNTSVIHIDRHHTGSSPLSKICTRYTCFCYPFSRPICRQVALSSYSICNADCHWSSPLSLASS